LLSRKEGKIIRIGSLRHLQETNTQQFKGIRLNEVLLLFFRCLLILILTLLLSDLRFATNESGNKSWVLIEKGLENEASVKRLLDSVSNEETEIRWWAKSFPKFPDSVEEDHLNHFALLQQLKNQPFEQATVVSSTRLIEFKGQKIEVPENIRWLSVARKSTSFVADTVSVNQKYFVRKGFSEDSKMYFENTPVVAGKSQDTILVYLYAQDEYQNEKKLLAEALATIQRNVSAAIQVKQVSSWPDNVQDYDWLFWLSDDPIRSPYRNVIRIQLQPKGKVLEQVNASMWVLSNQLNARVMIDENVILRLAEILIPKQAIERLADQHDSRIMPAEFLLPIDKVLQAEKSENYQSADAVLVGLLFVILLIERALAYKRNQ